jgi:glycosyltransferase involved in cell wall biosynthesis
MNKGNPLVSIIVRTKDRPILLKKALQSIAAQTYRPIEVVLVNDGGSDLDMEPFKAILGNIPLCYERIKKNMGRAHAGNIGIEHASGKYIGLLDDDDEFYSDHVSVLVNILENYDHNVAYTDANISFLDFDPEGKEIMVKIKRLFSSQDFSYKELLIDNYIPLICLLFSKEILQEFRGFDERFEIYEDWDLLIRIGGKYPFYHAPKQTVEYVQWSKTLQISQTPEFIDRANSAHLRIISKHRGKYTADIVRELVHIRRTLRDKDYRINELDLLVQEKKVLIATLEETVRAKEARIVHLERSVKAMEEHVASFEKLFREQEEQFIGLKETVKERDGYIISLEKTIQERDGYAVNLEKTIQERDGYAVNLEKTIQERDGYVTNLEKTIQARDGYVINLEKTIQERDGYVINLEKTIQERDGYAVNLEKTIQARDTLLTEFGNVIREREMRIEVLENVIDEQKGLSTHLERNLQARDMHITELKKMLQEKEKDTASLEKVSQEQSERIANLEQTIIHRELSLSELEEKLHEKESRIAEFDRVIHEQLARIANLENTLAAKDGLLADIEREVLNKELRTVGIEQQVREKESFVARLESMKEALEHETNEKEAALKRIYSSNGWKGLLLYYKVRDRLFPQQTLRRKAAKSFAKTIGRLIKAGSSPSATGSLKNTDDFLLFSTKRKLKDILPSARKEKLLPPYGKINEIRRAPSGKVADKRGKNTIKSPSKPRCYNKDNKDPKINTVLVAGVYLADQQNAVEHIVYELNQSACNNVVQKWIVLVGDAPSPEVQAVTAMKAEVPQPKFILLNKLLKEEQLEKYDYILICDDDIFLPEDFLDNFLDLQRKHDFALAQPSRTHNSFIDHPFVQQFKGLKARRTRFVEIGPLISIRRDAFRVVLPFDESTFMGWGYDFVWPCLIEQAGLRMGIIDATPVDHSLRRPVQNYNYDIANQSMFEYLSRNPHLPKDEAFKILESYT